MHVCKSPRGRVSQNLEWGTMTQIVSQILKDTAQCSPKHATSSKNSFFFWGERGYASSPDKNVLLEMVYIILVNSETYAPSASPFHPSLHFRFHPYSLIGSSMPSLRGYTPPRPLLRWTSSVVPIQSFRICPFVSLEFQSDLHQCRHITTQCVLFDI